MSEPLWVSARYRGLDSQGRQQWEAAVMDGERRVGPVVKSHSRKSARSEAYGALGAMNRIAELERELKRLRDGIEDVRPELYWRKWNALARRDIPVFREQMDKVYDRLGRVLFEQPEKQLAWGGDERTNEQLERELERLRGWLSKIEDPSYVGNYAPLEVIEIYRKWAKLALSEQPEEQR